MKKALIILILLNSFLNTTAQEQVQIGYYYKFVKNTHVLEVAESQALFKVAMTLEKYAQGTPLESLENLVEMKENWIFKIIKLDGNLYIFKLVNMVDYENRLFAISQNQIINYTQQYRGDAPRNSFVTSAITIPIKIRPGDGKNGNEKKRYFDFEGNINIGVSAGFRSRISENGTSYLSYLGGISIGATKVTSETISTEFPSETNASILTPFVGLMYEYNDFQIGTFIGWDHIGGKLGRSWLYQGKMWLGVGLGYNIFTSKEKNPD